MNNSTDVERALKAILNQTVSTGVLRYFNSRSFIWLSLQFLQFPQRAIMCLQLQLFVSFVLILDWAVHSLWVYVWGNAAKGQRPYWKTGKRVNTKDVIFNFACLITSLISSQDLCSRPWSWPPLSALQVVKAEVDTSCNEACRKKGLICEPAFFPHLNSSQSLAK